MCNPRYVEVKIAQNIERAWQSQIDEVVQLEEDAVREARVERNLATSLGQPVLQALAEVLGQPNLGWIPAPGGFRFEVDGDGGYAFYSVEDCRLEIVASRRAMLTARAAASKPLEGTTSVTVEVSAKGRFYHDNWGGYTEEEARAAASENAQKDFDRIAQSEAHQAQHRQQREAEESRVRDVLRRQASEEAGADLARQQAELEQQARAAMSPVYMRGIGAFNQALAVAYRNAIVAFAKNNNATNLSARDTGNQIEVEFMMERQREFS
jgi:hypothetical protein